MTKRVSKRRKAIAERPRVHIRWMIRRDMNEVLAIEVESFEFPWTEEEFIRSLSRKNIVGMVAEHRGRIVAHMIYKLYAKRLRLINFAVTVPMRRQGVGSQMAEKLIEKMAQDNRTAVVLEVRETNLAAQLFFKSCGFLATGVLRNSYRDQPDEDAFLFRYQHHRKRAAG